MKTKGLWFSLKYLFKTVPGYCIITLIYYINIECSSAIHNIWVYHYVVSIIESGNHYERLFAVVLVLALYSIVNNLFMGWYIEKYKYNQEEKLGYSIKKDIFDKAANIRLEAFENPQFYDEVVLLLENTENKLIDVIQICSEIIGGLLSIMIALLSMLSIGMGYNVLIIGIVLISLCLSKKSAVLKFRKKKKLVFAERKYNYYANVLSNHKYMKDIQVNHLFDFFRNKFLEAADQRKKLIHHTGKKISTIDYVQNYVLETCILQLGVMAYLAYDSIIRQAFSLTQFVTVYKGINVLSEAINGLLGKYVSRLLEYSLFVNAFHSFVTGEYGSMDYEESAFPNNPSIEFKNVCFAYPGSNENTINHLSMRIPGAAQVAIVGLNGAGKSTLINLLLGLYAPQSGSILINDAESQKYKLRGRDTGLLFQQFNLYSCSIAENVAMDEEYQIDEVLKAAKESGFDKFISADDVISNREITKDFDKNGLILSGGQQQLLASARLFYRKKNIFILDEPSSKLDPSTEAQFIDSIKRLTRGTTTIIVSHRLSMTKDADRIFFLENGQIVEQGNHQSLLEMKGRYAALWKIQAEKYQM